MNQFVPLNRQPLGILDFLGIKNGGQYPQTLGQVLAPTWDLQRFYLDAAATQVRATGTFDNTDRGTTISLGFSPPVGQLWYIDRLAFTTALLAAGQTIQISMHTQKAGLPVEDVTLPGNWYQGPQGAGGLETYTVGATVDRILYPGDQMGIKVDKITDAGGSIAYSCVIRYTPLTSAL